MSPVPVRLALGLEYDGRGFAGWQTQPAGNAVQDVLQGALQQFCGRPVPTICAGRTDAGVHATAQVIHLDAPVQRPLSAWVRGVNRFLPPTVAVGWALPANDAFHARFSATARRYDYWIYNRPVRSPLLDGRAGWVFRPLNVAAMTDAAGRLTGRHDFTSFRSSQCQAASPERDLQELSVLEAGDRLRVRAVANAFLHHMVRNLVGLLVDIGLERHAPDWAGQVLAARNRQKAPPTFPPSGLYLTGVSYPLALGLPSMREVDPVRV